MSNEDSVLPIGSVYMTAERALVLMLRAEGEGGLKGDAFLELYPEDADYATWLAHVSPIAPGETKPVPPWTTEEETES
jgi:hypothetical protein